MQKALPVRVALFFAAKNHISTIIRIFAVLTDNYKL